MFNPLEHPITMALPRWSVLDAPETIHVPLLMCLVDLVRPRTVVDVGITDGVSVAALSQALDAQGSDGRCVGVVDGAPDPRLAAHLERYGALSSLHEDISPADVDRVDMLHIGSVDASEAADLWVERLGPGAVVAVHGIAIDGSEAARLWRGLRDHHPSVEVSRGLGLGIAAIEPVGAALGDLIASLGEDGPYERFFEMAGEQAIAAARSDAGSPRIPEDVTGRLLEKSLSFIETLESERARAERRLRRLEERVARQHEEATAMRRAHAQALKRLQKRHRQQIDAFRGSWSWRLTRPLRTIRSAFRRGGS